MLPIGRSMGVDMLKNAAFLTCIVSLAGCSSGTEKPTLAGNKYEAETPKLEQHIGWFHGQCLAIKKADLPIGSTVQVALLDSTKFDNATVLATARDGEKCPALAPDRAGVNQSEGNFFYLVSGLDEMAIGIGVAGDIGPLDSYTFNHCQTTEGIRFEARRKAHSEPVWTGYYYLGYESEATCSADD